MSNERAKYWWCNDETVMEVPSKTVLAQQPSILCYWRSRLSTVPPPRGDNNERLHDSGRHKLLSDTHNMVGPQPTLSCSLVV